MVHLTLNTGHSFDVPAGKVQASTIRMLSPMVVKKGDLIPNCLPWRTVISTGKGCAVFDIRRGKDQIAVMNAVAWTAEGAEKAWNSLEKIYMENAETLASAGIALDLEMPEMPTTLPWLATWILPTMTVSLNDIHWMSDFEQCLAATIISRYA